MSYAHHMNSGDSEFSHQTGCMSSLSGLRMDHQHFFFNGWQIQKKHINCYKTWHGKGSNMRIFTKKRIWISLLIILLAVLVYLGVSYSPYLQQGPIGCGYKAKILCSGVFVSERDPELIIEQDLSFHPLFDLIKTKVDFENKEVTASLIGLVKAKAIYTDELGGILLSGADEEAIRSWPVSSIAEPQPSNPDQILWPTGDLIPETQHLEEWDLSLLNKALDKAFEEPYPEHPLRTRAVVVVYRGDLIAEQYAENITQDTPLIGWSMSKSITNALVGLRVKDGKLDVHEPAPVPEWQDRGDPRSDITLNHLLTMSSGLEFQETYESDPISDVNIMLFTKQDMGAFAASFLLEAKIGDKFNYSSGTANIISRIIRHSFDRYEEYLAFPRKELFNKIGMRSAVLEPDASGTFMGSSSCYATARDWARFGLFYLQNGVWDGEQVLPEGWVEYTTTPTPASIKRQYGALFWLNTGNEKNPRKRRYPQLPRDAFFCLGHNDQSVTIIPSKHLVVVRLGMTTNGGWDMEDFIADILDSMKVHSQPQ
ncbi:MAG: serine hydrolase [Candidatus Aminicenantes bacterium]|nr:serine hydrolase [Candidatus Aminicenantes bacterium]